MTDARLPARWLTDPVMDALSDRAIRTFHNSLMWSNEAGTDGRLPQRAMRFLHPEGVDNRTLKELIDAGIWQTESGGVFVPEWNGRMGQELAEVVEGRREGNRKRQQLHRERKRVKVTITGDVTGDVTGFEEDRTGQDTTGQAYRADDSAVPEWPVAEIGRGRKAS